MRFLYSTSPAHDSYVLPKYYIVSYQMFIYRMYIVPHTQSDIYRFKQKLYNNREWEKERGRARAFDK